MSGPASGLALALGAFALYSGHDVLIKLLGGTYSPFQVVFFSVLFAFPMTSVMLIGEAQPGTLRPVHPWWMAVVAAVGAALAGTIVRHIGRDERPVVMLLYPTLANFVVMGAALPFVYEPMAGVDFALNGGIAILAFVAMLMMIEAYKRAEAALVAPMQYSQILWAIFYGWVLFGEWPGRATFAGVALIIASGLYIVFREASGGTSAKTPVLETRTRAATPAAPQISVARRLLRRER